MDDHSDDEIDYRRDRFSKKNDSSDSHLSISDDEEDAGELEIKPPQAKLYKHSHHRYSDKHSSGRQVHVSTSGHRHKSHHSRRHQEERYFKERFDMEFSKSSTRSVHMKDYEAERLKEYEEYRRKKSYSHHARREEKPPKEERYKTHEDELRFEERYKEDLREKIERRKLHHQQKEHDREERKEREHKKRSSRPDSSKEYTKEPEEKRRRHHEPSESSRRRDRDRISEKVEHRHSKSFVVVSEDSFSPGEKETVVDVEMSPPVLKNEYEQYEYEDTEKEVKDEQEEEEEEEEEGEADNTEEESSSASTNSSGTSADTDSSSSTSSSSSEEAEEDQESETKSLTNEENTKESTPKEETPPLIVATNDDVDTEIELEKDTLPSYFPAIQGCRSVEEFQCLNRIEEGTYGVVYRAREKRTDKIVALKRLKMEKEKDGFPITSLREINTLLKAQHPNIVTVKEIVVGSNMDKIFIVMDYVEHDLKSLMETMKQKKTSFVSGEVKCLMQQLLSAVNHLHDNWILHRDLKTSNLLFSHTGILKVGDFGLAREYGSPLKQYTPVVVTLWYRAPELLLGAKEYSTCIDMWSVGCIFAEFLCMAPLFPGKAEIDQLNRIFKALGTPNERLWPDYSRLPMVQNVSFPEFPPNGIKSKFVPNILTDLGYDLLTSFLTYNTKTRITAETALKHKYFSEHPLPIEPAMFPTWPSKSEPGYRKAIAASSPKPPSGGQGYKDLREDDGFYIGVGEHSRGFSLKSTFSLKF